MRVAMRWRNGLLAILACLVVAGCGSAARQPTPADQTVALPGERGGDSGGGGGSGGGM